MADLPIEEKIDLKDALDRLVKTKGDAIDVMIYMTLKWKPTDKEIAGRIAMLKLKSRDRITIIGKS